jgi:hypothetical protein
MLIIRLYELLKSYAVKTANLAACRLFKQPTSRFAFKPAREAVSGGG